MCNQKDNHDVLINHIEKKIIIIFEQNLMRYKLFLCRLYNGKKNIFHQFEFVSPHSCSMEKKERKNLEKFNFDVVFIFPV